MQVEITGKMAEFAPGYVLTLDMAQAEKRLHALKHLKGSNFKVIEPVQFKAGEILGVSGKVTKTMLQNLKLVEKE